MIHQTTRFLALTLAAQLAIASLTHAQNKRPQRPGNAPAAKEDVKPAAVSYKQQRVDALDDEVATLLQRRGEAGLDPAMLELQIDLRLLARGVVAGGLGDKLELKPEVVAAYHRHRQLVDVATVLAVTVKTVPATAQPALKRVHDLTYRPIDATSVANTDALARDVAGALATLVPGVPQAPMRPARIAPATGPGAGGNAVTDLVAAAHRANVTPGLRRQLVALADAASGATDPAEARALTVGLNDAVDLANGLATNTAVDLPARRQVEQDLAEGLALFTDVRTRDVGRARLKAFAPYRQTLVRVGKLKENPDALKLGKLFVWASGHGEDGAKALAAVEAYNEVVAAFEARKTPTGLPPNVKRAADGVLRQFASARATFMEDAIGIGAGGIMAASPKQLDEDVAEMKKSLERLGLVERSPSAVDTLLAYKPRPVGAIEKKVIAALISVSGEATAKMPEEDAVAFLSSVDALASASKRVAAGDLPTTAADAGAWAGQGPAALSKALTTTFGSAVNALATPAGTVDAGVTEKLAMAGEVCDLLREAGEIDKSLASLATLARWSDWGVTATQVEAIVKPYKDAAAVTVDGLIDDSPGAGEQWPRVTRKYGPVVAYLREMAAYVPPCSTLPDGPTAAIARLATPLDERSFTDVRATGALLGIWATAEATADMTTADEAAGALGRVLGRRN